ncbi:hypothetical protein EBS80_01760 [bacterium]|nr:hypothetical protein [bacterium]
MGFLYSWERVQRGAIPSLSAFPVLRDAFTAELRASPAIVAGSVYGSVTRGDVSTRSDMDLFLVYETAERARVRRMLRGFRARAVAEHVSLHMSIHSVDAAAETIRYGPSFRQTWERMRTAGLLVGEPERYYRALFPHDVRSEMSSKIRRYVAKVRRQQRRYEKLSRTRGWMSRHLERWHAASVRPAHVHVNVARWLLLWRDGALGDDGKYAVVRRVLAAPEFASVHADMLAIRDMDAEYGRLLARARRGSVPSSAYNREIRGMLDELLPRNTRLLVEARRLTNAHLDVVAA